VGLVEGFGLVDLGCEGEDEALACMALNWRTREKSVRPARVLILFLFGPSPDWGNLMVLDCTITTRVSTALSLSKSATLSKDTSTFSSNIGGGSTPTLPNSGIGSGPVPKSPCSETCSDPIYALTQSESPSSSDGDESSSTSTTSKSASFGPRTTLDPNCTPKGFQITKFHPNSSGISSNHNPIEVKSKLFKNLKGLQTMGKGGEIASPIPSRNAVKILMETEEKTDDGEEAVRRRLPARLRTKVELHLLVAELLEIAIGAGG